MTRLRELLDELTPPIRFVRAQAASTVHVVAPDDPAGPVESKPLAKLTPDEALELALALRTTICGVEVTVRPGARGGYVEEFLDEDLCGRCHRILGAAHQHLAFAHPQPDGPGALPAGGFDGAVLLGDLAYVKAAIEGFKGRLERGEVSPSEVDRVFAGRPGR